MAQGGLLEEQTAGSMEQQRVDGSANRPHIAYSSLSSDAGSFVFQL